MGKKIYTYGIMSKEYTSEEKGFILTYHYMPTFPLSANVIPSSLSPRYVIIILMLWHYGMRFWDYGLHIIIIMLFLLINNIKQLISTNAT